MTDQTPSIPPDADDAPIVHPFVGINQYIMRATTHMIGAQITMIDFIESACLPVSQQADPRADEALNACLDLARDNIKEAQRAIRQYRSEAKPHEKA